MGDYKEGKPIGKHIKLYEDGEVESIDNQINEISDK